MTKLVIGLVLCATLSFSGNGQQVNWIQFQNLRDSLSVESRPLIIFIHTDWCKYCEMQRRILNQNAEILNRDFYLLELNAELEEPINFFGRTYDFVPSGNGEGYHELVEYFNPEGEALVYPTLVIISKSMKIYRLPGLVDAKTLMKNLSEMIPD